MKLSVIILNYNVRYFLELCILSVQNALKTIDSEIIVVDNNSNDGSCEMLKERYPEVILIENNQNLGFPKGNNIGVAQAKGEYICILNPDTVVAEDTFLKIITFANQQTQLGIIGCKLIDGKGKFLPESKRGIPTPFVALTKIVGLYKLFPKTFGRYYAHHLSENQTGKVDILVGAFMFMKSNLYNEVGGFDENCFMYADDIDLSYLVLKQGLSNFYFHETTVIHYKGESTDRNKTYMKRNQQAMNFFFKKHFQPSLLFSLFMEIGIVLFSILKLVQGKQKSSTVPEKYILVSDDLSLKNQLENQLQQRVEIVKNNDEIIQDDSNTEIIFNQNQTNFKTIINAFEKYKNLNFTFKIIPKSCTFMIGSNTSFDKGEVIKWSRF